VKIKWTSVCGVKNELFQATVAEVVEKDPAKGENVVLRGRTEVCEDWCVRCDGVDDELIQSTFTLWQTWLRGTGRRGTTSWIGLECENSR
jgi:hypothetical protein